MKINVVPEIMKVAGLQACNFSKRRLQQRYFLVNFAKFLRTAFHRKPLMAGSEISILSEVKESSSIEASLKEFKA